VVTGIRRQAAIVVVTCMAGVVACATTPPPAPTSPHGTTTSSTQPVPATPVSARTPMSAPSPRLGLADELEISSLDTDDANGILEFASDGASVIYSAGATDAAPDAAPDLWRVVPGPTVVPELVWRNDERDHSIVKLAGDLGTIGFVEMPIDGERAWNLWLVPRDGAEAILLDSHSGDEEVSSLVPSFSIYERRIVWTAFDRGASGPVSQLLMAEEPDWRPQVLLERPARDAELWLPSLYGLQVAFTEVTYADDRSSDTRTVHLMHLGDPGGAWRLDTSGLATMPLLVSGAVLWKEADLGFNMFNWGRMYRYDMATGQVRQMNTWPQEYVNYPSAGDRFVAWWGARSDAFGIFDLKGGSARLIASNPPASDVHILRPHVAGDLLAWLEVTGSGADATAVLRYAELPPMKGLER
jgi:hypothetical protein